MPVDASQQLRDALGVTQPIRLAISSNGRPKPEYVDIESSYAIIGRGSSCDVVLTENRVSFRHAYLQAFKNRVLCVDLLSAAGMVWDGPDSEGWLTPAHRISIVDSRLQLLDDGWTADGDPLPTPLDCKTRDHDVDFYGELPDVHLELSNKKLKGMSWPINRVMTLLGRDPRCRITCGDERISRVHCSLLLTSAGLWVIDLLGRNGLTVNGTNQSVALLREGDELGVGQYRMIVAYETPPPDSLAETEETDSPASDETSEFPVVTEVATPTAEASASLPQPEFMTRNNTVFPVMYEEGAIVVMPKGGIRTSPYQQIQLEANIITQLLATRPTLKNIVVDAGGTDAMDSIMISSLSAMCRAARHKAAICNCSDKMLEVLTDMSLTKIWKYFPTREKALEHVRS